MFKVPAADGATSCVSIATELAVAVPVFRHRELLKSSASRRALLAVQAAMSVGIVLTSPAQAQTSLPGSSSTVYLSNYGGAGGNPFSISSGIGINPSGVGVYGGPGNAYIIGNGGSVASGGTVGINLLGGGSITNTGTITGGTDGVAISGGNGAVYNTGDGGQYIAGVDAGVVIASSGGTVINSGLITESGNGPLDGGVMMNGGYLYNQGAGMFGNAGIISGGQDGIQGLAGHALHVVNDGLITGLGYNGISLYGGGSVSNAGTIYGDYNGIAGNTAAVSISNSGTIIGESASGIQLDHGGAIYNSENGTITGEGSGIAFTNAYGSVVNHGLITGNTYAGIGIYHNGAVANLGGTIIGTSGVQFGYAGNTITSTGGVLNSGMISGTTFAGVAMYGGGHVTNQSGGTISVLNGTGYGIYITGGVGAVTNAGLILGGHAGVEMDAGGYLSNVSTGLIIGANTGVYLYARPMLGNSIFNAGLITSTSTGVYVSGAGGLSLDNAAGGTIISAHDALQENAAQFSLDNTGLISGTDGTGLLASGGALASVTNESGGTISGHYYGLEMDAADNQVDNKGLISSSDEYYGIQTEGTMAGIVNEAGATILGVGEGVISSADQFTLDNAGSINASFNRGVFANGTISNAVINRAGGTITGPYEAVWLQGEDGSLQNAGLLKGEYAVVMENTIGAVLNTSTGTITGGYDGVYTAYGEPVSNAGFISGSVNAGIELEDGGQVVNSGAITGGRTGISDYGYGENQSLSIALTVFNSDVIQGGTTGIQIGAGDTGEISNADGGLITGGTYGIAIGYTNATAASLGTIFNSGDINGGQTGIILNDGGLVSNAKTGVITGGTYAVQAGYAPGQSFGTTGIVDNAGQIIGVTGGVRLTQGGAVTNEATGTISGGTTGVQANALTDIDNAGLVTGGGTGIMLSGGGTVVNTGNIAGGVEGLVFAYGAPAVLTNAGHITGTLGTGVALAGGALNNQATGVIRGGVVGVLAGPGASIINAGQILDDPAPGHAGVFLGGNAALDNTSTGTISGEVGVLVTGDDATITDAGAIISTDGGDAIQVAPTADPVQITLTTGARLTGAIDGGGTPGTITLTGHSVLNNNITNFSAGSQLTIAPGAVWTGAGNWSIANVNNTGTFQAGTLNAPLYLTGNFNSTGTLNVIVTPTESNRLIITGTATLSGNLAYEFAPGTYMVGKKYNFLTATGGATGGFSTVAYNGDIPDDVTKSTHVVFKNGVLGSNLTLSGTVNPLDGSIFAAANQDAAINAEAANDELLGKANGGADNPAACAAAARAMPDANAPRGASTASRLTGAVANAFCGAGGWIEATGTAMTVDDAYTANDAGFLAGIDKPIDAAGTRLGLAIGYDESWANDNQGGKASAGTVRVGLYVAQPIGAFTLAGDLMYGHAADTSTRPTGLGDAAGSYGADIINGGVQLSTSSALRGIDLTPSAGLKFAVIATGGFAETAPSGLSPFAVKAQSNSYTSAQPYLNLKLSKTFTTSSLVTITPSVAFGYALEAGNNGKSVNLTSQDGTWFNSGHTNLDASGAKLAAGITAGKNNWALYASYAATIAGNYTAQAGEAGLQINF
jgi:hypothetical protein